MRAALPALLLAGCTSVQLPADPQARLDPVAFFTGATRGEGRIRQVFGSTRRLTVESRGTPLPGGGLRLSQRLFENGDFERTREWVMRPVAPGRYTGTLTEAVGPVEIVAAGPRATIRYTMQDGLQVHQKLAMQDARTLLNRLEVRKFGLRVATVEETIRKLP